MDYNVTEFISTVWYPTTILHIITIKNTIFAHTNLHTLFFKMSPKTFLSLKIQQTGASLPEASPDGHS